MSTNWFQIAAKITSDHAERLRANPDLARQLDARFTDLNVRVPLDVSLHVLAAALAGYGLELRVLDDCALEVGRAELTRQQALALNKRNARDEINFTPADGLCWSCNGDLVEQYGVHAIAAGQNVTGCRSCNRSFCD